MSAKIVNAVSAAEAVGSMAPPVPTHVALSQKTVLKKFPDGEISATPVKSSRITQQQNDPDAGKVKQRDEDVFVLITNDVAEQGQMHQIAMIEHGDGLAMTDAGSGGDEPEIVDQPGASGAETPTASKVESVGSSGGGIGSLPIVVGGLALAGGGLALAVGGKKDLPPVVKVNTPPTAVADVNQVSEDNSVSGSVATNDSDVDGDTLVYTLASPVAGLALASNGGYTFNAGDAAYQNLAAGQTRVVVANYSVSDGKGGTAASTLTITVTGTNDAPTFVATPVIPGVEDVASINFTVSASDIDAGDILAFAAPAQSSRGGSVTGGAGGNFVYVPLPDFNGLDTVVISVTDRSGAVATQTVTFDVASNPEEIRSIDIANDSSAVTYDANGSGFTLGDNFKFTDNSALPTNARIVNFAAGDTIEVTGASRDYNFSSTGNDLLITFNNTAAGVLNQIVLVGVATGFISDEASAESALGRDFFRALTDPVGGGTGVAGEGGNLDLDNDANIATTAIVSAAGGDIVFTENANIANNVRITDFGVGDSIVASNANQGTYSFTSIGSDIVVTANNAGVVSQIVIAGVAAAGSFVTDEASAEASVGFNFFSLAAASGNGGNAGGTTSSQSIDNGSNLAIFDAATSAINFTDVAASETNVTIQNFSNDDRISVTGATAGDYNFGTGDNGRDLVISYTDNQTNAVNSIVLDDVLVGTSAFIFNYESAAVALGFDFMVFG